MNSRQRFANVIDESRRRVAAMDDVDAKSGSATPLQCGQDEVIATAMAAIEAGIGGESWDCVADAYVMLEQLLEVIRR